MSHPASHSSTNAARWLQLRSSLALIGANARYWTSVHPIVARELEHWRKQAHAIADPRLRDLAISTLEQEQFNAQVAATLCTTAPPSLRRHAVRAVVALEVMYDYLDKRTEQRLPNPLSDGERLYTPFTTALDSQPPENDAEEYLQELASVVRENFAALPAAATVRETAQHGAARCAQAQVRVHAAARIGEQQLREWATREAPKTSLGWREYLAGAMASVLCLHALIAAACEDRTTPADAEAIDAAYLSISALSTMLDSLIDQEQDERAGQHGHLRHYTSTARFAECMAQTAGDAAAKGRALRHTPHHAMTLAGVVSYYASAPEARSVRPIIAPLRRELGALLTSTLAVMRIWRLAKRIRAHQTNPPTKSR